MADRSMQTPPKSRLLCLPVEIRLLIYPYCCTNQSPGSPRKFELQVLQLCQQIHNEAWPYFFAEYGRHKFWSLLEFITWVASAPSPYVFGFVKKVCLRFSEASWEKICNHGKYVARRIGEYPAPLLMSHIRLDASIIYAFMTSLDSVRHVRTLQIDFRNHGDGSSPSNKYHSQQQLCLDIVARKMRNVDSLDLACNILHLDVLQSFHNLRHLRFSGYARATSERFLHTINTFTNLERLELLHVTPQLYLISNDNGSQNFAVSAAVLAAMSSSLKSISVTYTDSDPGRTPPWFTVAWMKALLRHGKTLQYLKLHCYYQPMPVDVFWALLDVLTSLGTQSLKHIKLHLRVACVHPVPTATSSSLLLGAAKDTLVKVGELRQISDYTEYPQEWMLL